MNKDDQSFKIAQTACDCSDSAPVFPMAGSDQHAPCCESSAESNVKAFEKPGYRLWPFVEDFKQTAIGPVPRVKTWLEDEDKIGTLKARMNVGRAGYQICPGLYSVGDPDKDSPVLVTANYKLSFDTLRKELEGIDAWMLVLDTVGINVWCAAGKGTFSTDEVVRQVKATGIEKLVDKKELILPQLSAVSVCGKEIKRMCGFKAIWGPIRAKDIKPFLAAGKQVEHAMRRVTFTIMERCVLIPVEISLAIKPFLWVLLAAFLLSGIGKDIFSFSAAWTRSLMVLSGGLAGIVAGAIVVPVLLPWIPGISFSVKGALSGIIAAVCVVSTFWTQASGMESVTLFVWTVAVSSYLAMNFTGSTPFTSPSGVEKEMKKAIPVQATALVIVVLIWVSSPFM